MKKWRNDFSNSHQNNLYYDLFDDFDLIESSFTQQYGIRLRKEINTMDWGEFSSLLSGISGDTVLGNVVRIRSEKDPKKIREFTPDERRIRDEWLKKNAKQIDTKEYKKAMDNFKNMFKSLAKKEAKK